MRVWIRMGGGIEEQRKERIRETFQRRKYHVLMIGWMRKGEKSHIISIFLSWETRKVTHFHVSSHKLIPLRMSS